MNAGATFELSGGVLISASGGATNTDLKQQVGSNLRVGPAAFSPAAVVGSVGAANNIVVRDLNDPDPGTNNPAGVAGEIAFNSDNSQGKAGFWGRGSTAWVFLG